MCPVTPSSTGKAKAGSAMKPLECSTQSVKRTLAKMTDVELTRFGADWKQQLRVLATITEDPSSVPSNQVGQPTATAKSSPKGPDTFFLNFIGTCVHVHTHTLTHTLVLWAIHTNLTAFYFHNIQSKVEYFIITQSINFVIKKRQRHKRSRNSV